ncbi:hypothetical protein K6U27_10870 [Vibrio fluvialis]|uniref:hypothetical protein n=1 Tax=Vibrio fluvialis TaxID=676 RepID=UPI001EEA6AB2|nr:hypothetical protein [Vibrio fluvialis]MCG6373174.1 hypothetical protein [Vibrio fluvialis]
MAKFEGDYIDVVHLRRMRRHTQEWLSSRDSDNASIPEQAAAALLELFFLEEIEFYIEKQQEKLFAQSLTLSGNPSALSAMTDNQRNSALMSANALMDLELGEVTQEELVIKYAKTDISTLKKWIFNNQKGAFRGIGDLNKDAWIRAARELLYTPPYSTDFIKYIYDKNLEDATSFAKSRGLDFEIDQEKYAAEFPLLLKQLMAFKYSGKPRILSLLSL